MELSIKQSYIAMFNLLDTIYDNTRDDCLGSLIGGFNPHLFADSMPADSAAWNDWGKVVRNVSENNVLTEEESLLAAIEFIRFHKEEFGFDLKWLVDELSLISTDDQKWINCIDKAVKKTMPAARTGLQIKP